MKNSITSFLSSLSNQEKDKDFKIEKGDHVTLFFYGEDIPVSGSFITEDEDVLVLGIYSNSDIKKAMQGYAQENDGMVPKFSVYSKSKLKSITKSIEHA
jgi:hypothetical protein